MDSHRNCLIFSAVIRENLALAEKFTSARRYERGQTVYCIDDPADELFEIRSGRVKIVRLSPEGQQKILDIYQTGDFFGELCICGGHRRTEQAVALEPLVATSFQMQGMMEILQRKPAMVLGLLQLLCTRLVESQDHIATLAFENIPQRLARELLRLSRSVNGKADSSCAGICVQLTHEELAHLVGTSREMVTTVMTQFRQRGLLDYSRRHIHVDPARLEQLLKER